MQLCDGLSNDNLTKNCRGIMMHSDKKKQEEEKKMSVFFMKQFVVKLLLGLSGIFLAGCNRGFARR